MFTLTILFAAFMALMRVVTKSEDKLSLYFIYSTKSSPKSFDEDEEALNSVRLHSRGPKIV